MQRIWMVFGISIHSHRRNFNLENDYECLIDHVTAYIDPLKRAYATTDTVTLGDILRLNINENTRCVEFTFYNFIIIG